MLMEEAAARSATMRALLTRLDVSDLVVYLKCQRPESAPAGANGYVAFVSRVEDRRYIVVNVRCHCSEYLLLGYLGHELRHAVEIADAPEIVDHASLSAFYARVGFPAQGDRPTQRVFETYAAVAAEHAVRREIDEWMSITTR
jgi:hypothetical protein